MCILVINGKTIPKEKELINILTNTYPEIKSIYININIENTNVVMGNKSINIYGEKNITDILGEYTFKISPKSFYQVNHIQAEKLYELAIKGANITKEDIVFDLYCGIGTISLFASKYANKVYGFEMEKEAIDMAKENAKINNVSNVEFITGDVEETLKEIIEIKKINPDIVILDPPRKGLDNTSIEKIINIKPKKIVYISCNPATLVRDLLKLENIYDVNSIKPIDMFPFVSHVECVCVLKRR